MASHHRFNWCCGLFSAVMSCRLASAPSGVLQAVVNHYPRRSLYPGASPSSRPAGRTLNALLLVGTLNWSSSILSERIPCQQRGVLFFSFFFFFILNDNSAKAGVPREKPQESITLMCRELCRKHFLLNKKKGICNHHLQFDSTVENWSHTPEVCPPL